MVSAYTDGSFRNGKVVWAFVLVENDKAIHSDSGIIDDPEIIEGRQIGGECMGVMKAVEYAKMNGLQISVFYDYVGVKEWIADLWGGRAWRANKKYTQEYRNFMVENKGVVTDMIKIKSHSGNKWNEYVDQLAARTGEAA